ncbi:putative choline kinase 2 [Nymphaea thermarum]|nr:putative choline kinase 2 [Nymphaea thermarum]
MVGVHREPEHSLPNEALKLLLCLASGWDDVVDQKELRIVRLKGAMTNEVYKCRWQTEKEAPTRKVLVRIYGEGVDVFFDRRDEIRTFECMSKHGQGPRLLGRFPEGRVEEFIHARTLSASDLRDPEISALVAAKLREFHDLEMPGPRNVLLWDRLRYMISSVQSLTESSKYILNKSSHRNWLKAATKVCSEAEAVEFELGKIEMEISTLEKELFRDNDNIGFCHNDLQYGNIMMDEETKTVTIIDYEYAAFNPVAYDIANHFCEMAADYHTETPHILDFEKYPGHEERKRFVHVYLSSSGGETSEFVVEQLLNDVEKYTLASHLTWGLWGIISEHVNEIDFDYMEYARQRLKQYWLKKPSILGC